MDNGEQDVLQIEKDQASPDIGTGPGNALNHLPSPISVVNRNTAVDHGPGPEHLVRGSSRNSPEPTQTDEQGHYVGPASGASFMLRIQRKFQQQRPANGLSGTSVFTFGDVPLPETDPRFLILPPKEEAGILLRRYFEFASATHRYLHRPTVELWLQELYARDKGKQDQLIRSRMAVLLMVFATAETFPISKAGQIDPAPRSAFPTFPYHL